MEYFGKLYGKVRNTYIPLVETSEEVDAMKLDKKRLDFMEEHPLKTQIHGGAEDGHEGVAWAVSSHGGTLRDALDAWMEDSNVMPEEQSVAVSVHYSGFFIIYNERASEMNLVELRDDGKFYYVHPSLRGVLKCNGLEAERMTPVEEYGK